MEHKTKSNLRAPDRPPNDRLATPPAKAFWKTPVSAGSTAATSAPGGSRPRSRKSRASSAYSLLLSVFFNFENLKFGFEFVSNWF